MKIFSLLKNKIVKNIVGIGSFRVLGILSNFLLLGVIYRYLSNDELYGLWLTISSILTFIYLFDFGIGNGLRNKLTESIHNNNFKLSSKYISTSYIIMIVPTLFILIFSFTVIPIINWISIFNINISDITEKSLSIFMLVIFSLFSIQFYLTLIFAVLHSIFKSYYISIIQFLVNLLNLALITSLHFIDIKNIVFLGIVYVGSYIIVLSITTLLIFRLEKQRFSFNFKYFDKALIKPLFGIGLKFLVLQFAIIVLFNTDNILISKFIGTAEVTPYQLTYKLLGIFTMFLGIILTPIWSVIIQYNVSNDFEKIKKIMKKILYIYVVLSLGVIITGVFVPSIINIWMGTYINISSWLIICVSIFVLLHMWCNIFQSILNGLTKLNIQVIVYGISGIINIPFSILLVHTTNLGVVAIVLGTIISMMIPAIILPIYTFKLLKKM